MLSNLNHLVKSDFPKLANAIHEGDWYVHQILENPDHEEWIYECLLGPATSPHAILQFMPHGGEPQVQYFLTGDGNFDEPDLTSAQLQAAQAFIDSVDPGHPRLEEEEKQQGTHVPKPKAPEASQAKGGCMSVLLLPLVVGASMLSKWLGWL